MALRDLFRPRTEHSDTVRARAVAALTDKGQLLAAALDPDEAVWRAAIDRLDALASADGDGRALEALAEGPTYSEEQYRRSQHAASLLRRRREGAVAAVEDPATLAALATAAEAEEVRRAAVARIDDEALLARIARESAYQCEDAVARIRSEALLRDLALHARSGATQRLAIARLTDTDTLARIAADAKRDAGTREAAVDRLRDPRALAQLVIEATPSARLALARLDDPAWLAQVALEAPDRDRRLDAIARTVAADVLTRIVLEDAGAGDGPIWRAALGRLRDLGARSALATIARSTAAAERRTEAVRHVGDSALLFELATSEADAAVRRAAAERVTDPDLLRRLAEQQGPAAAAARARLDAPSTVVADALRGSSPEIRLAAIARLRDIDALDEIIETAREAQLVEAATARRGPVKAWRDTVETLQARIGTLKGGADYREELRIRVEGDAQIFEAIRADADSAYRTVERLEAELESLIAAGPAAA